jgi:hypothetical protein
MKQCAAAYGITRRSAPHCKQRRSILSTTGWLDLEILPLAATFSPRPESPFTTALILYYTQSLHALVAVMMSSLFTAAILSLPLAAQAATYTIAQNHSGSNL